MATNNNLRKELIMDKPFKLLSILFVLSILTLSLTGCTESAFTLILKVDTPRDGTTVNTSAVTVNGRVTGAESTGAKVSINGADVPLKDGKFSIEVTLTEGQNVINIDATSGVVKLNEKVNVTYVPAKK
jgi:hypothetical protein